MLAKMDAYWRAANYLSVGQIYLKDNPLLERPLTLDDVKPRLLGHWGTTPGLNFLYVHWNRLIRERDLNMIYIIGPGHGGPGLVANTYLEGSYSEIYPHIEQNKDGIKRLFRQFSWPYGIPSHVAPETPGSIHEGGELGYSLVHAYGAAFDNPDLIVACVVGDGEAETGPLATSWHSNKFLNPATDGAVLPILHLNGYKIANPTVLARIPHAELEDLMRGYGYEPFTLEGDDPAVMHQQAAAVFDTMLRPHRRSRRRARRTARRRGRRGPCSSCARPRAGPDPSSSTASRSKRHLARPPGSAREIFEKPEHLRQLEEWMRSYKPEELFDEKGHSARAGRDRAQGPRRMGMNAHANGGLLLQAAQGAQLPRLRGQDRGPRPGKMSNRRASSAIAARRDASQQGPEELPRLRPRRDRLQPPAGRDHRNRQGLDGRDAARGRESVANRPRDGGAQRAHVPGLARGLPAHRPPRLLLLLRGLHPHHRLDGQPARQVAQDHARDSLAQAHRLAQLPAQFAGLAAGSQRLQHQDPGFIDHLMNKKADVVRIYLPPDANTLLSVADHCLRSRNYINLIVAGKQPAPQWLTIDEAIAHCTTGSASGHGPRTTRAIPKW
jgi:xylulose-5-phosphate/fructose-6-phosphate phosphoketolase